MPPPRGDYTEILLRKKLIDAKQLADAEKAAKAGNISVGEALVKAGNCTGDDVARALAQEHRLDYANQAELSIPAAVIALMPESIARDNAVLPLSHDGEVLKVIVSDPLDLDLQDKLRFVLNSNRIDIALAPKDAILGAINRYYGGSEAEKGLKEFSEGAIDFTEAGDAGAEGEMDESSAPIIRLVQMIITEAVTSRASDIHIEPFENRVRVRYRIDGVLVERDSAPKRLQGAILSRIKILAKIDIAERRRPQDGRIKVTVGDKELDLRVSVLPTTHGQSVVMRVLDKDNIKVGPRHTG